MMKWIMPIQNKKKWTKDKPQVPERAGVNYMYIYLVYIYILVLGNIEISRKSL